MPLEHMTLNELRDLSAAIDMLCRAGGALPAGAVPSFHLRHGEPLAMSLNYALPLSYLADEADRHRAELEAAMLRQMAEGSQQEWDNLKAASDAAFKRALAEEALPRPVQTEAVTDGGGVDVQHAPTEPPPSIAFYSSPADAPTPPVGGAADMAAKSLANSTEWTDARDRRAVQIIAEQVAFGSSWKRAYGQAADALGCSEKAVEVRTYRTLRPAILAQVEALRAAARSPAVAEPEPVPTIPKFLQPLDPAILAQIEALRAAVPSPAVAEPQPEPVPEPVPEAAPEPTPPAEAAPPADPTPANWTPNTDDLGRHLWNMSRLNGWDMTRDHDLMRMACQGFDIATIAGELGKTDREVKARFDALRKNGHFARAAVLARLAEFIAAAA